jgi:cytochrome c
MNIKGLISFFIALIGAIIFVVGLAFITKAIYTPIDDGTVGYTLPLPEVKQAPVTSEAPTTTETPATSETPTTSEAPATAQEEPAVEASLASLLATADIEAGKKVSRKCSACHSLKEGGKTMVGPALWDIIGHDIGIKEGYKYSAIFQELGAAGKSWTYENLDAFFLSPKTFAPKTKMTFSGLKSAQDRADLLIYLQSLSANPVAIPTE